MEQTHDVDRHLHYCIVNRKRYEAIWWCKSRRSRRWTRTVWDAVWAAALVLLTKGS